METISSLHVIRIHQLHRDSLTNGLLIGLAVGSGAGVASVGAVWAHEDLRATPGGVLFGLLIGAAAGAAIGAAADNARVEFVLVYEKPSQERVPLQQESKTSQGIAMPTKRRDCFILFLLLAAQAGWARSPEPASALKQASGKAPAIESKPASDSRSYAGWAAMTVGGGKDVNTDSAGFALVRGALGIGSPWVGLQTSLAYVREGGVNLGDWSIEGLVRLRRLSPATTGAVPYLFAGPGLFFNLDLNRELRFNYGGGLEYFVRPQWGLRFEVRDSLPFVESTIHHLECSGGVVWRF